MSNRTSVPLSCFSWLKNCYSGFMELHCLFYGGLVRVSVRSNKQCGIHIMLRNTGIKEQQWQK